MNEPLDVPTPLPPDPEVKVDLPRDEDLTCAKCAEAGECPYEGDPYNTNGDCLAMK